MFNEDPLNAEDWRLEEQLRQLVPGTRNLSRDHLMFQAGQRVSRRHVRTWQAVSVALLTISIGWSIFNPGLFQEPPGIANAAPSRVLVAAPVREIVASRDLTAGPAAVSDYLRLRYLLVMAGGQVLPEAREYSVPGTTETIADWQRSIAPDGPRSDPNHKTKLGIHGDRS